MALDTINVRVCSTVQHWQTVEIASDGFSEYDVAYNHDDPHHAWTCTCPSFIYRRRGCKHIERAKVRHCQYGWEGLIGSPVEIKGDKCPECGADVIGMRIAV